MQARAVHGRDAAEGREAIHVVPKVPPKQNPDEVGDPQCGDFGDSPDGIQYFEVQPGARKVLFVRVGQDIPLFDEQTLRLLH